MHGFAKFIMHTRFNAVFISGFFGAMSIILLPLSIFSSAALGLVELRKGGSETVVIAVGAGLLIILTALFFPERPGFPFPLVFALWVPVLIAALVLRQNRDLGNALLAVGVICALLVISMHIAVGDIVAWWTEWMRVVTSDANTQELEQNGTMRIFNGFVAMMLGFAAVLSLIFARWMQAILYNPGGLGHDFNSLAYPRLLLPVVVAILVVAGLFSQDLMANLFQVSLMLYFFQGLAVIHGIVASRGMAKSWLVPPYLILMLTPLQPELGQYMIMGLAFLGAVDSLVNFRVQRNKKG